MYTNVGYIVEQEGDSFTVVFHEAEDAVAFTLQVGGVAVPLPRGWVAGGSGCQRQHPWMLPHICP
jgi:hypothetical protein